MSFTIVYTIRIIWMLQSRTSPEVHDNMKHDLLGFCRQISAGLNYLSSKHFIHRDLAARNVLVSSDDVCKVSYSLSNHRPCSLQRNTTPHTHASGLKLMAN